MLMHIHKYDVYINTFTDIVLTEICCRPLDLEYWCEHILHLAASSL